MRRASRLVVLVVVAAIYMPGPAHAGKGTSTTVGNVAAVFHDVLGMGPLQANELALTTMPISVTPYRYADDLSSSATLFPDDVPWAAPTGVGAAIITFPDDYVHPTFDTSTGIMAHAGSGIVPGDMYVMFWASSQGAMTPENMNDLFVNVSFPTTTPGAINWIPQLVFPGDTWGGFSRIPYLTYGPNPWSLDMDAVSGSSFTSLPINGGAYITRGVTLMLVPLDSVLPPGAMPEGLTFSYALHVHDGSFGAQPTSLSTITAVPEIPVGTTSDQRTGLPVNVGPTVVGEEPEPPETVPPETTSTTSTTTTTPTTLATSTSESTSSSSTPESTSDSSTTSTSTDDGDGNGLAIPLIFLGIAITGGGIYLRFGPAKTTTTTDPTPWPAVITGTSTDPGTSGTGILIGTLPPKGDGAGDDEPPKVGLRV